MVVLIVRVLGEKLLFVWVRKTRPRNSKWRVLLV